MIYLITTYTYIIVNKYTESKVRCDEPATVEIYLVL